MNPLPAPKLNIYGDLDPKKATKSELKNREFFFGKCDLGLTSTEKIRRRGIFWCSFCGKGGLHEQRNRRRVRCNHTVVSHIVKKPKGKMKTDRDFLKNYALLNSQIKLWPQLFTTIMSSCLLSDGRPAYLSRNVVCDSTASVQMACFSDLKHNLSPFYSRPLSILTADLVIP